MAPSAAAPVLIMLTKLGASLCSTNKYNCAGATAYRKEKSPSLPVEEHSLLVYRHAETVITVMFSRPWYTQRLCMIKGLQEPQKSDINCT